MNDDLSAKSVLMWDYGLFEETAVVLARTFGKVMYYCPWKSAYPASNRLLIGEGLDEIVRVRDFFDHVREADLIVFPDLGDGDLQLYLRENGKRVWGGGKGEELENFRWRTKGMMKELGMPTSPCKRVQGMNNLRDELKSRDNLWIKISTMRGDMETWHHLDYRLSELRLDELEHKLGARKVFAEFIVEDDIPNAVEAGYDGWCIDGKWPSHAMLGYEIKGSGLIGKTMAYENFPKDVVAANEALSPILKSYNYRGFFSSELRNGVLIDPCCRTPSPPGELYPEMFGNFAEVIWHGANGDCIDPEPIHEFGVEITIESDWSEKNWEAIYFPKEIRQFVKLRNFAKFNGQYYVLPMQEGPRVGAVIGLGSTLKEAALKALKHAQMVEGYQIECDIEAVAKGFEEIRKAQEQGVNFTTEEIPSAEELIADSKT